MILDLVDTTLLEKCKSDEGKVFLHKLQGDYYRYIAEYATDD